MKGDLISLAYNQVMGVEKNMKIRVFHPGYEVKLMLFLIVPI